MRVTIKDVAREAHVSVATVSRVFNGTGPVRESVRDRVTAVAKQLRYTPNAAARSLTTNRTGVIGAILPDLHGEFFSEVIRGLDQAAQRNHFHLLVSSSHNDAAEIEAAVHAMHGRVDGLVIMAPGLSSASIFGTFPRSLPILVLNASLRGGSLDTIGVDNYGGAVAITKHLLALGHTRIAIVTGPPRNYDAAERLRGYRDAMRKGGHPAAPAWEIEGDFTEASGFNAVETLLRLTPRPTAVFAANDAMAIGALSALRAADITVPGGIAVTGFDDIPLAQFVDPPLTSVSVPMGELGARAIRRMLARIAEPALAMHADVLPTALVVRRSCGAPNGKASTNAGRRKSPATKSSAPAVSRRDGSITKGRRP